METTQYFEHKESLPIMTHYDVIVCGAGVAGVAAAVSAARAGSSVLLLEKSINLGGLATSGLINMFVPGCNGRGTKIIKGMNQELFDLSIKYGYDTVPDKWKDESLTPEQRGGQRFMTTFSPYIFALTLTELVKTSEVSLLLDCTVSEAVMSDKNGKKHCDGIIVQTKSGRRFYPADVIIDTTGDADLLKTAGVPCIDGKNYFTYCATKIDLDSCQKAVESQNIERAIKSVHGGNASLYGDNQPTDKPLYNGTSSEDVTEYITENQLILLDKLKNDDRLSRELVQIPFMPQFRTTRCIKGGHTFSENDAYRHFDDSIAAICDFDHRDYLYEVPYRCLVNDGFDNLITAGRSACASGYGWDILRVIPPAIVTGQAAGVAASMASNSKTDINAVDISRLQDALRKADVMIHFDDALIPKNGASGSGERFDNPNHI